jgi:hypothetical protein
VEENLRGFAATSSHRDRKTSAIATGDEGQVERLLRGQQIAIHLASAF